MGRDQEGRIRVGVGGKEQEGEEGIKEREARGGEERRGGAGRGGAGRERCLVLETPTLA
jgi:hypothetical protein